MKTLSKKPSSILSIAPSSSSSSIVTAATAQTDATSPVVTKAATELKFSSALSDQSHNDDDIIGTSFSSTTDSRLSSFLTPSASLTNTDPVPNPRKQNKEQQQQELQSLKKNQLTKAHLANYSAYSQSQATKPFVVPDSFKFEAKELHEAKMAQTSLSFAASATDFAYLHLEAVNFSKRPSSDKHHHNIFELDLICWKIILKKALSTYLGISGEAIPTDILNIINPSPWSLQKYKQQKKKNIIPSSRSSNSSVYNSRYFSIWGDPNSNYNNKRNTRYSARARRNRRYLSYTGSESSLSDSAESIFSVSSYTKRFLSNCSPQSKNSTLNLHQENDTDNSLEEEYDPSIVRNPQVWVRIPEQDLTKVWMALSGFSTSIDTGNYGNITVGVRVIRASKYIFSTTGAYRNKW